MVKKPMAEPVEIPGQVGIDYVVTTCCRAVIPLRYNDRRYMKNGLRISTWCPCCDKPVEIYSRTMYQAFTKQ